MPFSLRFFLLCFLLCCFAVFAIVLLSPFAVSSNLSKVSFCWVLCAFPLVFFSFLDLFFCKFGVLLCPCMQVYLRAFLALVPVCLVFFTLLVPFVCFIWGLKSLIYAPRVLPSTMRPSFSLLVKSYFCCLLICSGVHKRLSTVIRDSLYLLPVSEPSIMFPHTHAHP